MRRGQLIGALALALAMGLGACAPRQPEPIATVRGLEAAISAADRDAVHAYVDYAYRLSEVLGDVYDDAPEADRARAVALARSMFERTTDALWASSFAGRPVETRVSGRDGGHVWVESTASGDGRPPLAFRYRLTLREGRWRVTQREYVSGPNRSNTGVFYPMALNQLAADLGRAPTLAELNANLPSLQGRIKVRTYRVPELPSKPGKR